MYGANLHSLNLAETFAITFRDLQLGNMLILDWLEQMKFIISYEGMLVAGTYLLGWLIN